MDSRVIRGGLSGWSARGCERGDEEVESDRRQCRAPTFPLPQDRDSMRRMEWRRWRRWEMSVKSGKSFHWQRHRGAVVGAVALLAMWLVDTDSQYLSQMGH